MKKEIKYKDIRIGSEVYTVKMNLIRCGGIFNGPAVNVDIMKWHLVPCSWWERFTEFWRYSLHTYTWDPQLSEISLEEYIEEKCAFEAEKIYDNNRGLKEWEVM